ncbi:MAG TPA: primosomal protein N' [Rectinemataceae bacterium]
MKKKPAPEISAEQTPACYVKLAFPLPLSEGYWYSASVEASLLEGRRVEAPLGKRKAVGFVVETACECPIDPELIKPIRRVVDAEALYGAETLALASWVSSMYFSSLGEALGAMLPTARREGAGASGELEDFRIGDRALDLGPEQADALEGILGSEAGSTYLFGATGTGKTEVFLQAAEKTLEAGGSVIYLVPEIALTGQVVRQARRRFGETCAVIHSRLSPSQKLAEWRRILKGEASMVIGVRSAIFAPVKNLGLIVIDEEHEGSYKSGSHPRYHARQVAMRRASAEKARLILGSATPSVEAFHACRAGAMKQALLTNRLGGGAFPSVEIVDMSGEKGTISKALAAALEATKQAGRQSILFLNRRGFSHFFSCSTCGAELRCRHCSVSLTWHKEKNQLVCHYCGYRASPPQACPECGSLDVGWKGFGTERVEEELAARWPSWRIGRLDADSTEARGSLEKTLASFGKGELDLLVGTQMVAKGLNFPGVATVGLVMADSGLNLPDFRASERVFSLIVQVAGRAGRNDSGGTVFIQTFRPGHPVIRLAASRDLETFYAQELAVREELGFPPFSRLARIVFRSRERDDCIHASREFAGRFHGRGRAAVPGSAVDLLGPAECPLAMVAGTHRWQILLRAKCLPELRRALLGLFEGWKPPRSVRLELDIDPVQLL